MAPVGAFHALNRNDVGRELPLQQHQASQSVYP